MKPDTQVRTRACSLVLRKDQLLMVRLEDPVSKKQYLFPPGGKVESGESPVHAAQRETLEETGYRVHVDETSESLLRYPFHWGGTTYQCATYFYRASLTDDAPPLPVTDTEYHRGVVWLPVPQLEKELAYHPQLSQALRELLRF
jgi:8-oxo-dGTP pyrophosphatase MutT (NUDIX family)